MSLISVIVPVYKVEPYLNQCIESIVNQTYQNLEIILVDDGSPDNCPAICDAWAEKDPRIQVIHQENSGLSAARNSGLRIASGDYVAFVDSDDWIHESFVSELYKSALKHHAQISACEVAFVEEGDDEPPRNDSKSSICFNAEKALSTLQEGKTFRAVAWNKLYLKDLLKNEIFEEGRFHEDEFFTYRILAKADRLVFVNSSLYFYRQRSESIMTTFDFRHLDALDAYYERMCFFKKHYPDLYRKDKLIFCVACVNLYLSFYASTKDMRRKAKKRIRAIRKKINISLAEFVSYPLHEGVYIIGSGSCLELFCRFLYRIRRKKNQYSICKN